MALTEFVANKQKERKSSTEITSSIFSKLREVQPDTFSAIKPAFYLGQICTLSLDYVCLVDELLLADPKEKPEITKGLLYLREVSKSLLRNLKEMSSPLDNLVLELNEHYEKLKSPTEQERVHGELEEFAEEQALLQEKLRVMLSSSKINSQITTSLSELTTRIYMECVYFIQAISRFCEVQEKNVESLLNWIVDIQYGLEWQMRLFLEEDISTEDGVRFSPDFFTWSALALNELFPNLQPFKILN